MLLPQVLRSRACIARPLLQRSIRPPTRTAARAFATAAPETGAALPETHVQTPIETQTQTQTPIETETQTQTPIETETQAQTPIETETQAQTPIETQTPTETPIETQTPIETPIETQTPTKTPTETPPPRPIRLRKLICGPAPIRRVRAELKDPDAIARAAVSVHRTGEDASYRIVALERLLALCRDPTVAPPQNIMVRRITIDPHNPNVPHEATYCIRHLDLAEERRWWVTTAEAEREEGMSPIMAVLGVDSVAADLARYVIVNHHVTQMGIGMDRPSPQELAAPIESFYPRRIHDNISFLRRAGRAPHVLLEIKDGRFQPYPRATAMEIIYNQIKALASAWDHKQIRTLPQVKGKWTGMIYRSLMLQLKQCSAHAAAILAAPADPADGPVRITRGTVGVTEDFARPDAMMLYLEECGEAMRKVRKLLHRSPLAAGDGAPPRFVPSSSGDYESFAEMALLNRRITENLNALRSAPRAAERVIIDTFFGASLTRRPEALATVSRQVESNIKNISKQVRLHTPARAQAPDVRFVKSQKPDGVPVRFIGYDSMARSATTTNTTTTTIPGGAREYSTVSFSGLEMRRDGARKNAFGCAIPGGAPARNEGPVVAKEGSVRHRLQAAEAKRLSEMQGMGYSLMASAQMGGAGAVVAATVVKEDDGGGVSTWEGTGEFGGLNDESGLTPLKKGDLCELRMGTGPRVGIYLRPSPNGQPTADFLLESGERAMYAAARVTFAIPSFISAAQAAAIIATDERIRKHSELPPSRHSELVLPRPAVAGELAQMRAFTDRARALYAEHKGAFVALYERMAERDTDTELTLFEAAEEVFGTAYGDEMLYTAHLALMDDGVRYLTDKGAHRATSTFKVRAKRDVQMIEFVTEQVRLGTGAERGAGAGGESRKKEKKVAVPLLESFARKARTLIDMSRRNAEADLKAAATAATTTTTSEGPVTRVAVSSVQWDQNDLMFIDYIKAGVLQYGSQSVPMDGLVPVILRAVDRYEGELDNITAYQFVTDIGAWNKWEDLSLRQKNMAFPGMGTSRQADEDQARLDVVGGARGVEQLQLVDSLKHMRKDWGAMEVFAIDDITAHEIDDGISLERVDDKTNWVHVHIANPTAWLPPNHWLADLAFRRRQSLYLPTQVLPMLPPALTDRIGLASGRGVMTMSAKVDMAGEVLEYRLQPGFVRNVKRFTYDAVSAALGCPPPQHTVFEIGQFPATTTAAAATTIATAAAVPDERQTADLHTLSAIALAFRRRRVKNDLIFVVTPRVSVDVHTGLGSAFRHPAGGGGGGGGGATPHLYHGHPAMRLKIEASSAAEVGSNFLVSEIMQLANSVTARFCGAHGIAAPFRVMEYDYERADLVRSYKRAILPARDALGSVPTELGIQYMMLIGKTRISAAPSPHRLMGLDDGYIRATSPLRRYSDMITHWQIEAFLRGQEPRTHRQITPFALELERGERLGAFTMKESTRFWAAVAIKRLMDLRDPRLPRVLTFMVMEKVPFPSMSTGLVWELGMAGKVAYESATQEMDVRAGDTLEVEPMAAMPGEKMVWFKYRRVIKRRVLDDLFL